MPDSAIDGVEEAAARLQAAWDSRTPCLPVREVLPDGSARTAYAVQNVRTAAALRAGRRIVGRKVGLTSTAVQRQLGVDQPDFGVLFDDMAVADGAVVGWERLLQPRIEAEIAFVLSADLDAADLDEAAVRPATAPLAAALEIVDSRIASWDITFADTVADNASSAMYVLGPVARPLGELDLLAVRMSMTDGTGAIVSRGTGADCLGDPVAAVLWLAVTCRDLGVPLRAGEVVLSGALGPMVPVVEGGEYTASLSELDEVRVRFSGGNHATAGAAGGLRGTGR
jgi:2-keto-4-pentenoate hydratase